MIITRAPFRVSFCGGGSDLPSFYREYGPGCVISTSIKKYMYLALHNYFYQDRIVLKYSKTENVNEFSQIEHKIFRQCLMDYDVKGVEITSMADVPAGTGLGSSSTFTVALLHLLNTYKGQYVSSYKLAKEACNIEIEELAEPIGKQDQFAAAFGGLNFYEFHENDFVKVEPIIIKQNRLLELQNNLMMFYTGDVRSASDILKEQSKNIRSEAKASSQKKVCQLTRVLKEELEAGRISSIGEILDENWAVKKELASGISNSQIDDIYSKAILAGAKGGKLLGAGGGGFLLFYAEENKQQQVRKALGQLREMKFEFDNSGSSIVYIDRDY